jgi:predicted nuclease of restriction endonuclease-like (RecB) superfamily
VVGNGIDPTSYSEVLERLKKQIRSSRSRAVLRVNADLVALYWSMGREILVRQEREGWGTKVVARLSADLRSAFPEMRGLSRSNLMSMRAFAAAWPDEEIVQQVVGQLPWDTTSSC